MLHASMFSVLCVLPVQGWFEIRQVALNVVPTMWFGEMEQLWIYLTLAHKLQIHKDKGCDDRDHFSKQNTLLSHLSCLFPS